VGAAADLTACVGADLVVRAARLLDGRVVDIAVRQGRIETVAEHSDMRPPGDVSVIEADGRLVTPSFVNAHMHLDKVYRCRWWATGRSASTPARAWRAR